MSHIDMRGAQIAAAFTNMSTHNPTTTRAAVFECLGIRRINGCERSCACIDLNRASPRVQSQILDRTVVEQIQSLFLMSIFVAHE